MPLRLVSREEWKARKGQGELQPLALPVPAVIIKYYTRTATCTGDKECFQRLRNLQDHHMNELFYMDIKYNFLIGGDGTVYEGRGWHINSTKQDCRYFDYYGRSIDIAYIGDFQKYDPPPAMVKAANDLINYGVNAQLIVKNYELIENRKDKVMPYDPEYDEAYGNEHEFEFCQVGCGR